MKSFLRSLCLAFSDYSICPKSKMEHNKENSSLILLFIPLVGAIITVVINRWAVLYPYMCDWPVLPAIFSAVVPTILSAGSHLDGFFRTVDALSSHKSREEKLQILSNDTHSGYGAIIVCICYFMIMVGIWSEMPIDGIFVVAFAYIISRALYAISVLTMKHGADSKCSVYIPESAASKWIQVVVNLAYIAVSAYLMLEIAMSFDKPSVAIASYVGTALAYLYYVVLAKKSFGGITEELGGYFIVICEAIIPIAVLFAFKSPI